MPLLGTLPGDTHLLHFHDIRGMNHKPQKLLEATFKQGILDAYEKLVFSTFILVFSSRKWVEDIHKILFLASSFFHVVPHLLSPPCSLSFPLSCFPRLWEQPHTLTRAQLLNAKCGAFPWAPTRWPCGKWMAGFGSQFSLGVTWLSSGNGDTEASCGDCYNSWLLHFSPMLEHNAILFNKSKPPSMIFPLIKKLTYKLKFHHHVLWEETLILVIP